MSRNLTIVLSRLACDAETKAYAERRRAEGKTNRLPQPRRSPNTGRGTSTLEKMRVLEESVVDPVTDFQR